MFQNKTQKILKMILINGLILTLAASCSKAPNGVRAQVKTQQNVLNPSTTAAATQQAASNNANYTISTISTPQTNSAGNGFDINIELQMPSGQILPVTTHHDVNNAFSEGVYTDPNGTQVDIQANCSADSCSKYVLLVTVIKSSQTLFQSFAISYSNDCKFNLTAVSNNFYQSLSAAESAFLNVTPLNDFESCTQ